MATDHPSEEPGAPSLSTTQVLSARLNAPDRAILLRTDAGQTGRVYSLSRAYVTLGRHPDNQICIEDAGISRFHAEVRQVGNQYLVCDLDSANGTFVNGQRRKQGPLENGDAIHLGPLVSLRFSLTGPAEAQALQDAYNASTRDPLTGVFNRRYLESRIEEEIARAAEQPAMFCVCLFDIDHFKRVNDAYGHAGGDEVLQVIASRISTHLDPSALLTRYGGEEFVILMRNRSLADADAQCERVRLAVETTPVTVASGKLHVTISAGCASLKCAETRDRRGLLEVADQRLYAAKRGGRNAVVAAG